MMQKSNSSPAYGMSFNPLDRGNLYQMSQKDAFSRANDIMFQSPRSGKFVSDDYSVYCENKRESPIVFQSPRYGKFVSDVALELTMVLNSLT